MRLPDKTRVFLCHDYKARNRDHFVWETTMLAQRTANVHVHEGVTEAEFVEMRTQRDATLEMPRQIGRASCRERVCQYVSISVVAVSLKTKNIHNKEYNYRYPHKITEQTEYIKTQASS